MAAKAAIHAKTRPGQKYSRASPPPTIFVMPFCLVNPNKVPTYSRQARRPAISGNHEPAERQRKTAGAGGAKTPNFKNNQETKQMSQTTHADAAKSHETAAKAHQTAAKMHGKSDAKGALEHSTKAHGLSEQAHGHTVEAGKVPAPAK
jgi:hypothetical protein